MKTWEERIGAANEALQDQEDKFTAALERGLTGAPLVRIDQKLARLQRERDAIYDERPTLRDA